MGVRVDALPSEDEHGTAVVLSRGGPPTVASLEHDVSLTSGVRLRVDLARPNDWRRLWLRDRSPALAPLIESLIGRRATQNLYAIDRLHVPDLHDVDSMRASPWVRLAVLHGLDRWLQLPLEQDLLRAEIGVTTFRAAQTLNEGDEVRESLVDSALGLARRASDGVVHFLRALPTLEASIPIQLQHAADALVDGYSALRDHLADLDSRLTAVIESRHAPRRPALSGLPARLARRSRVEDPAPDQAHQAMSLIDPRHVRARVLRLGDRPRSAEISFSPALAEDEDTILVHVPAFGHQVDPEIARRLMVRLVDRTSGRDHSYAALTARARPSWFECTMPLRGFDPRDLRADVFDALLRPADGPDTDEDELVRTRRAVLTLRDSRRRAAEAELREIAQSGPGRPMLAELAAVYQATIV
jgi:hypothetical protein